MKGYMLGSLQTMPLALLEVILSKQLALLNLVGHLLRFSYFLPFYWFIVFFCCSVYHIIQDSFSYQFQTF